MTVLIWIVGGAAVLVAGCYLVIGVAMLALRLRIDYVPDSPLTRVAHRLLIVAPHPIDGVIIGAGQAMRTREHEGEVRVVTLTGSGGAATRGTWAEIGLGDGALVSGGFEPLRGLLDPAEVRAAIELVRREIDGYRPDRIVVPLYEGGHYQHDVTNLIAARALAASGIEADLFESPLYNGFYSWSVTPRKVLALLGDLVRAHVPAPLPEPVDRRSIFVQPMSETELAAKRRMVGRLMSCRPDAERPGEAVPDRLLPYVPHDYGRPPFDRERSLTARVEKWGRAPMVGRLVRRWARTAIPTTHHVQRPRHLLKSLAP